MYSQIHPYMFPVSLFRLHLCPWAMDWQPFSLPSNSKLLVISGPSIQAPLCWQSRHLFNLCHPHTTSLLWSSHTHEFLALGCQTLGLCLSGLLRQFIVWPSSMIWPGALANCAAFNTLHKNYGKHKENQMIHERILWIAVVGSFIWYWVPSYLFTGLSMFNCVCWIAPNNVIINTLFGTNTGLGMNFLTFDWGIISYFSNPLVTPVCCMPVFCLAYCSSWVIPSGGSKWT